MKKFIYHIEHTNGMDQNVWTSAENQYEAEQELDMIIIQSKV